jgi:hypothetical protein
MQLFSTQPKRAPRLSPIEATKGMILALKKNIWRAAIEVGFIIFLFYANLLMGEFERSGMGLKRGVVWAVEDVFTAISFCAPTVTPKIDPAQEGLGNNHCRSLFCFFFHSEERLIRIIEREDCSVRTDVEVMSNLEKVAGILPRHIGYTADLTLAPQ